MWPKATNVVEFVITGVGSGGGGGGGGGGGVGVGVGVGDGILVLYRRYINYVSVCTPPPTF